MKFTRIFSCLIILGCAAIGASAQVDPKVIINLTDPVCTPDLICYDGSTFANPLVESFTNPMPFVYTGTNPLTQLFIDLIDVPPLTSFQCQTNIWTDCSITPVAYGSGTVGFNLFGNGTGTFDGGGGLCGASFFSVNPCPDQLTNGQGGTFDLQPLISETPEPTSVVLFGTGILAIFATRKRRKLSSRTQDPSLN
jgi:hypothetical protein